MAAATATSNVAGHAENIRRLIITVAQDLVFQAPMPASDIPWPYNMDVTWPSNRSCAFNTTQVGAVNVTTRPYFVGARLRVLSDVNDTKDVVDAMGVTDIEFRCR